jgi:exodeoxyribonuclease VII small subunit
MLKTDATARGPRGGTLWRRCTMAGKVKEPSFEEALKGLEAVVERLESGEPPLEESIRLFEEGMRLSETCRKRLDEADRKIEVLLRKPGGVSRETAEEDDILGKEE